MKKKKNFDLNKIVRPIIVIIGFLLAVFLTNLTEEIISLDLGNAINIFSSGFLIILNMGKEFSILLAFLILLVPTWLFLYIWNNLRR